MSLRSIKRIIALIKFQANGKLETLSSGQRNITSFKYSSKYFFYNELKEWKVFGRCLTKLEFVYFFTQI